MTQNLDQALIAAHKADDMAWLIALYMQAGDGAPDTRAAAFYMTHAYVLALATGDARARVLQNRLIALGAENGDMLV
jgi:hypothetical protein